MFNRLRKRIIKVSLDYKINGVKHDIIAFYETDSDDTTSIDEYTDMCITTIKERHEKFGNEFKYINSITTPIRGILKLFYVLLE